ncbi:MAG: YlxM family DNA-binding protein [Oscillospiraceae bacterium]|nr:YlxM family DNA-binding protein [Oscillospiraceae bacterium]
MDETFFRTMLFDVFGEMLTEKQRDICDLHFNQDLSLQEIAEHRGTTRQAVWDTLRRSEQSLREMEEKTGLVARLLRRRRTLEEMAELVSRLPDSETKRRIGEKLEQLYD